MMKCVLLKCPVFLLIVSDRKPFAESGLSLCGSYSILSWPAQLQSIRSEWWLFRRHDDRQPPVPELRLVIPVPLEGEKGGIPAAREDLVKFAEREHFPIQLPMLVVGGAGNPAQSAQKVPVRTDVRIHLVPLRRLLPPSEEG